MIDKIRAWLVWLKSGELFLNSRTMLGPGEDRDVMKPRHVNGPLPANLVFRTAVGSAGVGGKENAETVSHVSLLA